MTLKKRIKHFFRDIFRLPVVLNLMGWLAGTYVRLVGATSRFDVRGIAEFERLIDEHNGGIFVCWHGRALMLPYFWRHPRLMKALVSPHADGRIIAKLLRMFKILSVDGSSDRNALVAALEINKELGLGTVMALIPDGPKGPSMRLNKSVIYFAQKSGKPVMGFTYSAKGAKVMRKSWDDMLLPPPFSQGVVWGTKPLFVPPQATDDELEALRLKFETELNELTFAADKACGLPEVLPKERKEKKKVPLKKRGENRNFRLKNGVF